MSGFSTSLTAVKFVSLHSSIHTFLSGLSAKRFLGYTVTNSTIQSLYLAYARLCTLQQFKLSQSGSSNQEDSYNMC